KNSANASGLRYKSEDILCKRLLPKSTASFQPKPQAEKVFTRPTGPFLDWNGGAQRLTGHATDFALEGEGFFVVKTPRGPEYTRSGNFKVTPALQLATLDGMPVLGQSGPIQIPPGKLLVNREGEVTVDGATIDKSKVVKLKDLAASH